MKDIIEQDFMIGFEGRRRCPNCEDVFKPRRPNMKFCCANCRKSHSGGIRNSQNSKTTARENMEFFDTAIRMGNRYYDLPPYERDGYMSELIADASCGGEAALWRSYLGSSLGSILGSILVSTMGSSSEKVK